jgi:pyruvate/2-oxoglutarate dehydrogenase complex dihydrolipoamide acyltransferase (E2) component
MGWLYLYTSGHRRARRLGTFGISVVSGFGALSVNLLSPLTTALNYGVVGADGAVDVNLTYDHRVLDGGTAARALEELERVLKSEIVTELRYLQALAAA